jgi:hypothetical protein
MAPTVMTLLLAALQPTPHTGLATVTIFLVFHILLVLTITIIFLSSTSLSFIGEAWHTVAKSQSANVVSLLDNASLMHDGEVERWVEKSDGKESASRAMILGENGGSEAAHVRKRWEATQF